jgi:hypothetical protein
MACEKESAKINNETSSLSIASYLEFPDKETFYNTINGFVDNPEYQPAVYQTNPNFKSFEMIYDEFIDQINDKNLSETEYNCLLLKYEDILTIEDSVITKRINHPFANNLINRQGLVKIGDIFLLYTDCEEIEIETPNITLALIKNVSLDSENSENHNRFQYKHELKSTPGSCGVQLTREVIYTHGDRRARLRKHIIAQHKASNISVPGCPYGSRYFTTYVFTEGHSLKKNIWGNWVEYKSGHTLDLEYQTQAMGGQQKYVKYYKHDNTDRITLTHTEIVAEGPGCPNHSGNYEVYYSGINSKYSTRGIDANWAVMQCGWLK